MAKETAIYIRMPADLKDQLEKHIAKLNTDNLGAGYTTSSLVRALIEKELSQKK